MRGKRRWAKGLLITSGAALCLLLILLATMGLWIPPLIQKQAAKYGVQIGDISQKRQQLHFKNIQWEQDGSKLTIDELKTSSVLTLLWSDFRGDPNAREAQTITLSGFSVTVPRSAEPKTTSATAPQSLPELIELIETNLQPLDRWKGDLIASQGEIQFGDRSISIKEAHLNTSSITAKVAMPDTVEFSLSRQALNTYNILISSDSLKFASDILVKEQDGKWTASADASFQNGTVVSSATLPNNGWTPKEVSASIDNFPLVTSLGSFLQARPPLLSGKLDWTKEAFQFDGTVSSDGRLPFLMQEVSAPFRVSGSSDTLQVEAFNVAIRQGSLTLASPLQIDWSDGLMIGPAEVTLEADLGRFPEFSNLNPNGNVTLDISTKSMRLGESMPTGSVEIRSSNISIAGWKDISTSSKASLDWPTLTIDEVSVSTPKHDLELTGGGEIDLQTWFMKDIQLNASGTLPSEILPTVMNVAPASLKATVNGHPFAPEAAFEITSKTVEFPGCLPLEFKGEGTYSRNGLAPLTLTLANDNAHIQVDASLKEPFSSEIIKVDISSLKWTRPNVQQLVFENERPFSISWNKGTNSPALSLSQIQLKGPDLTAQINGSFDSPEKGSAQILLSQFSPRFLESIIARKVPSVLIRKLAFNGQWNKGPLTGTLSTDVASLFGTKDILGFSAVINLSPSNAKLSQLEASWNKEPGITASGQLPVSIWPGSASPLRLKTDEPIQADIKTLPESPLWNALEDLSGIQLIRPNLNLSTSGSIDSPTTKASLSIARLRPSEKKQLKGLPNLPSFEDVSVEATISPELLSLNHGSLAVNQQRIELSAHVPLEEPVWMALFKEPALPDWQHATASLKIPKADIAAFADFLPEVLSPQGHLEMDANLKDGELRGFLQLTNAATHPFAAFGAVRDIHANVSLEGTRASIDAFKGTLGGEALNAQGALDFHSLDDIQLALNVTGTNIALVRTPKLVVRSDLALNLIQTNREPASITGIVHLHDSLFLLDLNSVIKRGVEQPEARPPYFRITTEPLADWNLDIEIAGKNFMQIRTPLFRGRLSSDLKLQGQLKDPYAIGELKVEKGAALFPFGDIDVQKGSIRLTKQNPHLPELEVTGSSRRFGYDVRFELTGTSEKPDLTFNSSPPLSSKEILLMLTVGEIPSLDYSFTDHDKAQRVAFFFGKDLLQRIGLGSTGEERLSLSSGENVTDQGKLTYYLEYRLTDDWSLVGEYDRFNALNAGVKWKVYSK